MTKRPTVAAGRSSELTTGPRTSDSTIPAAGDTTAVEQYLRALIARCVDDVPLINELTESDLGTARGTAAISRAALAWLRDKQPEAVRERLVDELAVADLLARYRIRALSWDLAGATDWAAIASRPSWAELERLRRYEPEIV